MITDKQPATSDYRARIARAVFVRTFSDRDPRNADDTANDFTEAVADAGGEVAAVLAYATPSTEFDPVSMHFRAVTYRHAYRVWE